MVVAMSFKAATPVKCSGVSANNAAHNMGKAAFLAPETVTTPLRRLPP